MDWVFHIVRFEGKNADLSFSVSSMELHSVFLWAAFRCQPHHHLPSLIRASGFVRGSYLLWSSCCFPALPCPAGTVHATATAFPQHTAEVCRGTWSASSSKTQHKHIDVPKRGKAGSVELCGIQLQPSLVVALCCQRTPHCAGDVTKCSLSLRKVRPIGWSRSDHFDLGPLWFEE